MEAGERIRKSFGRRLRAFRETANLSAETLASKLGVHPNTVWKLERGEQWVGADLLEKITDNLELSPDRLFSDAEPKPTPHEALEVLREALRKPKAPDTSLDARISQLSPDHQTEILMLLKSYERESEKQPGIQNKRKKQ